MSAPIDLISQVRAVTVYRRGAMVTRAAELVRAGDRFPERIQLGGLPLSLDDSSMRVEIELAEGRAGGGGESAVAPIAGDLRVTLSVPSNDPRLAAPSNEELDRAKLELALISAELEQLIRAEARLGRLQPASRGRPEEGKPPAPSPTTARLELLNFRRERADRLAKQILAQREREREAKERLASLRERERLASTQRNARTHELRKAAILELDGCAGAGMAERIRVKLHYFVPGARWAPAYTVRLDSSMRSASLELRAMVGQATGEDWSNVDLTLSTAVLQQWTDLPKLESQRIGRRQPPPAKTGWRPPPVGADELYADYDRGLGGPLAEVLAEPEPSPGDDDGFSLKKLIEQEAMTHGFGPPPAMDAPAPPGPPPGIPPQAPSPAPMSASASGPGGYPMVEEDMVRTQAVYGAPKRSGGIVRSMVGGAVEAVGAVASAIGGGGSDYAGAPASFGGAPPLQGARPTPTPEPELLAGRDLLDYGRLRLFAASHRSRGSLRRIEIRTLYQQLSVESVAVDLAMGQINSATLNARELERTPAPEGHRWPTSEAGFDYAYVADAPTDLRSDGQFHSLPIDLREAEATPRYIAVPRETQDVFRIVALRNPLSAPLLPGPADIYVGGKFALTSAVELTPRNGRIALGLGVEQAIKIARNVSFGEDSSGMFKRQIELAHTISIEIANHLPTAATVEVRERIPIASEPQAEDIKVEIDRVKPAWEDYAPDTPALEGGRRWIVEVPANETRELEARWSVRIPTNHELLGGNRREV